MKKSILLLVLAILLSFCVPNALADPEDYQGQTLPDFTVIKYDGATFTLSESLKTHELVLINFWATWYGPCRQEFPYLEQAWKQYGDRVDVIALSIESQDTPNVLRRFAQENSLTFSLARDDAELFYMMDGSLIPTTLIVDKDRTVLHVEIGSKPSAEAFTSLFDSLLGSNDAVSAAPSATRRIRINNGSNPNVRSQPNANSRKLGTAQSGRTYELLDEQNNWYKIRLENGIEGWISMKMATIVR